MNNSEHIKQYSAEDIKQYLSGKLTPLQMNAMEKAALEDPFLAEAMEGYEGMNNAGWQKELEGLQQHFTQQNQAKVVTLRRPNRNWMKAAAAILLIGGAATLSYFLVNKKDSVEIAQQTGNEQTTTDSLKINTNSAAPTELTKETVKAKEADNSTAPLPNSTLAKTEQFAAVNADEVKADSVFVYKPSNTITVPGRADALEQKQAADVVTNAKSSAAPVTVNSSGNSNATNNTLNTETAKYNSAGEIAVADKREQEKLYSKKEQLQLSRNFIAQVVAADNSPLPFANVNIRSENFGTYADVKGNFRLVSTDSVLTVEVKATGYKPQYYTLQSNSRQNRIVLSEDNTALKDFTVITANPTAKARTSRRATLLQDSVVNVEPADGWDNYNTYVDNNIEIPDDILQKNIRGRVELTFDVKPNGTITNITVDKSLCSNCDAAAKRLLQQGPQWKVKNGQTGRGRVTVQF
jgi:TonB family protein